MKAEKKTKKAIDETWRSVGLDLSNEARRAIKKKKFGHIYFIRSKAGGRKKLHRASKPFETHANLSSKLFRAVSYRANRDKMLFGYGVGRGKAPDYAEAVELGTDIAFPRPTIKLAIKKKKNSVTSHLKKQLLRRLKA